MDKIRQVLNNKVSKLSNDLLAEWIDELSESRYNGNIFNGN